MPTMLGDVAQLGERLLCKQEVGGSSPPISTRRRKGRSTLKTAQTRSSVEGHTVDALAPRADEGRGKLRKASGSRKQASIRGCPNGGTHPARAGYRWLKR
jgi:hypothetical protein